MKREGRYNVPIAQLQEDKEFLNVWEIPAISVSEFRAPAQSFVFEQKMIFSLIDYGERNCFEFIGESQDGAKSKQILIGKPKCRVFT